MKIIFIIILIFLLMIFIRYSIRTEFTKLKNNDNIKKEPIGIENYEYDDGVDIEDSFVDPTK